MVYLLRGALPGPALLSSAYCSAIDGVAWQARGMNHLADATSPYLLQHADNPVDWWEWGAAAFDEARRRDVPVLISVGYAACHWCHVMAHESFEDQKTAAVLNEHTVPVKVDREERPDVDAVYMTATQAMTGQGGWPMTVFATPDGAPFWCGTYIPKRQFTELVKAVGKLWRERRDEVLGQGDAVVDALRRAAVPAGSGQPVTPELLDAAAARLAREHDTAQGGFGGAPKFPPSMVLLFLLRQYARTGDERSLQIVRHTAARMARGGMYDQLAGGFARYAVDATWTVPHFEKMLYDNALLLRAYAHLWRTTGEPLARRVARETAEFLLDDLATTGEGFAASLDADTDGVEGLTYVWTPEQLHEVLGPEDGAWATGLLDVTGTFEHDTSVLQLPADPDDPQRWGRVRTRLRQARDQRPQPARDDKVVTAWNGLAVTALAEFAAICTTLEPGDPLAERALTTALRTGRFLLAKHLVDGRLRRVSRHGKVGTPAGVLDDHGSLAQAFCTLHQVDGTSARGDWLAAAGALLDIALERFRDADGAWYDTADDAERLVSRPADPTDNATPSGLSAVAEALVSYAALTASTPHRAAAEAAVAVLAPIVADHPRFAGHTLSVAEAIAAGPYQVAVVGSGEPADALYAAALRSVSPGAVVVAGAPDERGVPLLADRPLLAGAPAGYVCRGFVCDRPVSDADELSAQLSGH